MLMKHDTCFSELSVMSACFCDRWRQGNDLISHPHQLLPHSSSSLSHVVRNSGVRRAAVRLGLASSTSPKLPKMQAWQQAALYIIKGRLAGLRISRIAQSFKWAKARKNEVVQHVNPTLYPSTSSTRLKYRRNGHRLRQQLLRPHLGDYPYVFDLALALPTCSARGGKCLGLESGAKFNREMDRYRSQDGASILRPARETDNHGHGHLCYSCGA